MGKFEISDGVSAAIALVALLFSIFAYYGSRRNNRYETTIDIWKAWISKEYRTYRVEAYRTIKSAKASATGNAKPKLADVLKDRSAEEAIGSIEHFFEEVSKLMVNELLDKRFFHSLFDRSMQDWWELLSGFERDGSESFTDAELDAAFQILFERDPNQN